MAEVQTVAREHTADALKALAEIVNDKKAPASARAASAQILLDRGWGKPMQHVEATVNLLDKLSEDESRALAEVLEVLAREPSDAADGTETTHH